MRCQVNHSSRCVWCGEVTVSQLSVYSNSLLGTQIDVESIERMSEREVRVVLVAPPIVYYLTSMCSTNYSSSKSSSKHNLLARCTERRRCVPRAAVDSVAGGGALHPRTGKPPRAPPLAFVSYDHEGNSFL